MIIFLKKRKNILIISMLIIQTICFAAIGLMIISKPELVIDPAFNQKIFFADGTLNTNLFSEIIEIDNSGAINIIKGGPLVNGLSKNYTPNLQIIDNSEDRYDLMIYNDDGDEYPVLLTKGDFEYQYLCVIEDSVVVWKNSSKYFWMTYLVICYIIILFLISEYSKYLNLKEQMRSTKDPSNRVVKCYAYEKAYFFTLIVQNTGFRLLELFSDEHCKSNDYKNFSKWIVMNMRKFLNADILKENLIILNGNHSEESYQLRDIVKKLILTIEEINRENPKIAFRYSLIDEEIFYNESVLYVLINYFIFSLYDHVKEHLKINLSCELDKIEVDLIADQKIDQSNYEDMKTFLKESLFCDMEIYDKYLTLTIPIKKQEMVKTQGIYQQKKNKRKKYFAIQKHIVFIGVSFYNRKKILTQLEERGHRYTKDVYKEILSAELCADDWPQNSIVFIDAKQLQSSQESILFNKSIKWIGIFDDLSVEERDTINAFNLPLRLEKPITKKGMDEIFGQI